MKFCFQYESSDEPNNGITLSESDLRGFAYMITRGAPKGLILKHITDERMIELEHLGVIFKDPSIIITDYFYINSKYLNEIIYLYFDTFYRSIPKIKKNT